MRLCIVQNVLPLYAMAFFDRIVELNPHIELTVLADLNSRDSLNQYRPAQYKFNAVHLGQRLLPGIVLRPGIIRTLRSVNADVIVFSGTPREPSQLLAMAWLRLLDKPVAAWGMFHRIGAPRFLTNAYFRLVGSLSNLCLTYSRVGATNLVRLGVDKKKVVVVGTAIDEKQPQAEIRARTPEDLKSFRQEMGLRDKQLVLQVVRLSRIKHPELLVYAAAEICKVRDDVIFAIIGDGEMRQELKTLINHLGLSDNFKMLGAIYDERVLSYWYLTASAFVVPTFIGLSAHHAMAYGVPVVTDDSLDCQGSEFDILANGLNALLYKEGDPSDMGRVLNVLLNDNELRAQLSVNAKRTVESVHNLTNKTHQFALHVENLVKTVST